MENNTIEGYILDVFPYKTHLGACFYFKRIDTMLTPITFVERRFDNDKSFRIQECCDSVIAVLTKDQIDKWLIKFNEIVSTEDAPDFCDIGSSTSVFNVDEKLVVIVSDSGGELAYGEFVEFCDELNIESQFIIDSIDCTGMPSINDIYTGCCDNNMELVALLYKVFNDE